MSARRDIAVLFLTRTVRLTAYGTIGVILALYLSAIGLGNDQLGILLTLTLLGDSVISLAVTRWADRIGRRFMLISSCLLMVLSGLVYGEVSHPSFALLLVAATIGVLSPSGNEVGPFMALEQSILSELVTPQNRTHVFAWYNLVGYSATALGALAAGGALTWAQRVYGISELEGYRAVFLQYGIIGGMLLVLFMLLTEQRIVVHLSVLFAADSFAGGLLTGTLLAYYFQTKYGVSTAYLGSLLFGANLLAAVSSLLSGYVAARIGLINTMVFTHLPSNILMLLVPLMPNLRLAALMVFLRFSISQMDVAPRASYVAGVVRPDERTAAMGIVNIAKSIGAAFGPLLTGWLAERGLFHWSFYLCGGLKILYDLALLWSFAHVKPEH
ncbi:hypothetical protein VOLCADRAFT_89065 [Volvox carteri f. nagariensis]|uniref:Major facilitator superfamily (MFS) profile domain-containing protein n=1 Tax=Volvox carteri f. nagariensis TaxID=3068 RepID=D8TQQ0_VOLCA|nr:uncharacterized protein VOLCADRAFT_89065 [Volvox carteri f. nagariensis]EFJ50190.1 hypothetical protein VOLCADRAFT_89065 [Volvox carteri f. nagariensis]|eukprot:XP_002948810.1 hypothetical protein VOLCADRAFT_89065 [Volvox carteri f. nagariensis]